MLLVVGRSSCVVCVSCVVCFIVGNCLLFVARSVLCYLLLVVLRAMCCVVCCIVFIVFVCVLFVVYRAVCLRCVLLVLCVVCVVRCWTCCFVLSLFVARIVLLLACYFFGQWLCVVCA